MYTQVYNAVWILKHGLGNTESTSVGPTDLVLVCSVDTPVRHSLKLGCLARRKLVRTGLGRCVKT